jgi:hypothetical protein
MWDAIAVLAFLLLFTIFVLKTYNCIRFGEVYPFPIALVSFIISLFLWLLLFLSTSAALMNAFTIEQAGTELYNISSSTYIGFSLYLEVANILIGLITMLTIAEFLFLLKGFSKIKKPLRARKINKQKSWG